MTTKAAFTPEEWTDILQAPLASAMAITVASPSLFGSISEIMSAASKLTGAAQQPTGVELLDSLLAEFKQKETVKAAQPQLASKDPAAVKQQLAEIVTRAMSAVKAKATPEEVSAFAKLNYDIAVGTANASKEGGFLGFGAVRVSPEEQAALDSLAGMLGVTPASAGAPPAPATPPATPPAPAA